MLFSAADHDRIANAIRAAEARTTGEIVVIVSHRTHRYTTTALSLAALIALALPFTAVLFGWSPAALVPQWGLPEDQERHGLEVLIVAQALLFIATLGTALFTPLAHTLTPKGLKRDRVHAEALTQFRARGLDATTGRTGVLLYIDEPDHVAEIIADTGIYEKVPPDHWADTIDALIHGIKAGLPSEGLVNAITLAGDVLAEHFPGTHQNPNELPDHLIELH
jgi:putative membrane protein